MISRKKQPEFFTSKGKTKAKFPQPKKMAVARPYIIRELYTTCCIGHTSALVEDFAADQTVRVVQDFLVDSSGRSKGGESINPLIQVGLNASKKIVYSIMPEACKKHFKVTKPPGVTSGNFSFFFGRQSVNPGPGGFYDAYPATVVFNGLTGAAPTITYAMFFITNGNNRAFHVEITGEFKSNFKFTDIQIVCKYPARNFSPVFDFYKNLSYASPITLDSPETICFALFGYVSPDLQDAGPIIEVV